MSLFGVKKTPSLNDHVSLIYRLESRLAFVFDISVKFNRHKSCLSTSSTVIEAFHLRTVGLDRLEI